MKATSNLVVSLRIQGYSERAIREICRWFSCSTTQNSELPLELKN